VSDPFFTEATGLAWIDEWTSRHIYLEDLVFKMRLGHGSLEMRVYVGDDSTILGFPLYLLTYPWSQVQCWRSFWDHV
jgi:hypothetical protein